MDKKEFEQTIKLTEMLYIMDNHGSRNEFSAQKKHQEEIEEFEVLINDIADFYIAERKSNKDSDSWQKHNALVRLFSEAVKKCPELTTKQDKDGNTFIHKMAKAGFWSVCLTAVNIPNATHIRNNEGQNFVEVYGVAELKNSCESCLRLAGGASGELGQAYYLLNKEYPNVKTSYAEAIDKSIEKTKEEPEKQPLLHNIEFWFED